MENKRKVVDHVSKPSFLVHHVFQLDFVRPQKTCAGCWGSVDQKFKPELWKVDPVFKPSVAETSQEGSFLQKEAFLKKKKQSCVYTR